MKYILFVRHAKSDWSDGTLSDFDRPLNRRGKHDAPLMARHLTKIECIPTFILSSPANRALSTAKIFAKELGIAESAIKTDENLYESFTAQLIASIAGLPDDHDVAAIFSHNPATTSAIAQFSEDYIGNVPTCGIGVISFEGKQWADLKPSNAKLSKLLYPKQVLDEYK